MVLCSEDKMLGARILEQVDPFCAAELGPVK